MAALIGMAGHPVARFGPAVLLLAAFSIATARSGAASSVVDCHCFGGNSTLPVYVHLSLNSVLAVLGLAAMFAPDSRSATPAEWILGVGLGAILGTLTVFASDLYAALSSQPIQPGGST